MENKHPIGKIHLKNKKLNEKKTIMKELPIDFMQGYQYSYNMQ